MLLMRCGGVWAARDPKSTGSDHLDGWLSQIRDVYRLHSAELDAIEDENLRHRRFSFR